MSDSIIVSTIVKHLPGRHDQQRHAGEDSIGRPSKDPSVQYSNASAAMNRVIESLWVKGKPFKNLAAKRNISYAVKNYNAGIRAYVRYGNVDNAKDYLEYSKNYLKNAAKVGADQQKILDAQEAIDALS